jgi:hypothetical protein
MVRPQALLIVQSKQLDPMRNKPRSSVRSTNLSIEDEIAHLRGLDLKGLRARWQSVFQRRPPAHLPRHLLIAIVAYRIQADRFGDLDNETKRFLDQTETTGPTTTMSARLIDLDRKRIELTSGTVLVREWNRQEHRVMVMANGFAWNGRTYDSLIRKIDQRRSPGREESPRQVSPLRDLYQSLDRPGA